MKIIRINDKDYTIRFNVNSLILLEDILGKPFTEVFSTNQISLKTLRTLVYCGLKAKQSDITENAAGEIISDALETDFDLASLSDIIVDELTKALGIKKENPEKN